MKAIILLSLISFAAASQIPLVTQEVEQDSQPTRVHTMNGWSYENCGTDDDLVEVTSLEISPDPPRRGQNLTVKASGVVKQVIETGAEATAVVKIGRIKLITKKVNICTELVDSDLDLECPIQPGEYSLSETIALPKEIPPGKFRVEVTGSSADKDPLLCLTLHVDFLTPGLKMPW